MGKAMAATALAAAALAGTAAAQGGPMSHGPVFGERDDGRNVRLASPDFTVDLPRNAGTGYRWSYIDGREVMLVSQGPGPTPEHAPGIVGFPMTDSLHLRATGPQGELQVGLFPPGTPGAPARIWRLRYHRAYDAPPPRRRVVRPAE